MINQQQSSPKEINKPWNYILTSYALILIICAAIFFVVCYHYYDNLALFQWISIAAFSWLAISGICLLILLTSKLSDWMQQRKEIENDINNLYEKLEGSQIFTTLIRINFKYLDKYYLQTHVQADKSFYIASVAAIVSFVIIVVGICLLYFGQGDNKIESAYITIAAGALSEFISAVFFYLYNRTVLEMSGYHQKLVLTQNVSLALRVANELRDEETKSKAQAMIVESLTKDINMHLTAQASKELKDAGKVPNKA